MKRMLLTGANSRLGQCLIDNIFERFTRLESLVITSRTVNAAALLSDSRIKQVPLDLNEPFINSEFYSALKKMKKFDGIIHCAAPYRTERFMELPLAEFSQFTQYISNDIELLRELTLQLDEKGSFVVCGSVAGMRLDKDPSAEIKKSAQHVSHIGNFGEACTLHALHKGIVYDVVNCLYQANPNKSIVYLNLGAFMNSVTDDKNKEVMTTDYVAKQVLALVQQSRLSHCSVDVVAKGTLDKLAMLRELGSESFQSKL